METIEKELRKLITHSIAASGYQAREDVLDGRTHLVVPVVMMVEGVHVGSHGAVLHQASELAQSIQAWNGRPVTISHPTTTDAEGNIVNVSANSPDVLEQSAVGTIFSAFYSNSLRSEAWLDLARLSALSPETLAVIRQGKPLEVSIGIFNDTEEAQEGAEWNGETYESIASNYKPDHLALLPGEIGACSNEDGCGIRANKEGGNMTTDLITVFKDLSQKGYAVSPITNEQGYRELTDILQAKLNTLDNDERQYYLQEVYSDHFIYAIHSRAGEGPTLFKRGYVMTNNEVTWEDTPVEVRKKTEYVTMATGMVRTKFNVNKGGEMSTEKSLCCEAKVDALIANKQTHWQANNREWLLEQDEAIIAKMSPMVPETVEQSAEEIQANKDAVIADYKAGKKTIEDYTADMPEEMKVQIDGGVKLYKERKETLVKGIMDNTAEGVWTKDGPVSYTHLTLPTILLV